MRFACVLAAALSSSAAACSSSSGTASSAGAGAGGGNGGMAADVGPFGGDRPVMVHVPASYAPGVATPLVILLHGYSASGLVQDLYFQLTPQSDQRGFLYAHPDGTVDPAGNKFWNATDACCAFAGSKVDDSGYLSGLIESIAQRFTVDRTRIFLIGHSNGAFMSYRMACDHADQIAAVAALAGAMWEDVSRCKPSQPVSVLAIHGTADLLVSYGGSTLQGHAFPSAATTVSDWVTLDGCDATADTSAPSIDLEATLPGAETKVTRYGTGCRPGGHAELWTIQGGGHIPNLQPTAMPAILDFLYAHHKP